MMDGQVTKAMNSEIIHNKECVGMCFNGWQRECYAFFPNFSWHNVTLSKSTFDGISIRCVFSESVFFRSVFSKITYQVFIQETLQVIFQHCK